MDDDPTTTSSITSTLSGTFGHDYPKAVTTTTPTTADHSPHVDAHACGAAITTAGKTPKKKKKFKVIEIFSWAMVLSTIALSRDGWTAGPVCSIETGFDLTTPKGQADA